MRRLSKLLIGIVGTLLLTAGPACAAEPIAEPPGAADRACRSDADCTVVMMGCCDCNLSAVSRARENVVRNRIEADLHCSEVCPIVCEAPPVACVNQLCERVEARPRAESAGGAPKGEVR